MLKNKLSKHKSDKHFGEPLEKKQTNHDSSDINKGNDPLCAGNIQISELFTKPFWKQFYDLECDLNTKLQTLRSPDYLTHIYNPDEYAADIHCAYLRHFLSGPKLIMFVGMNPGPNGMGQTGVPFGNITTVRDKMKLTGEVRQPTQLNARRPVTGLSCSIDEPSGVRIWTLLERLAGGSLDTFSQLCFVHNFCPLAFFDASGSNITPNDLKGDYKAQIRDICLAGLDQEIALVETEIIVAIGEYVYTCLKKSQHSGKIKILKLAHPSPRSLNNQNWPQKAEQMLEDNNLLMYLRNELKV